MNDNQNNINSNQSTNNIDNFGTNKQPLNVIPSMNINDSSPQNDNDSITKFTNNNQNRFINQGIDTTSNTLNDLNVETADGNQPRIDYAKDPKVAENIKKRNTVNITSEGKVFIIIIIVLLLFIFVLPDVYEAIRKIMYQ